LTTDDESDLEPAWSADGRFVYFSSFRQGTIALWRVPKKGGTPTRVTLGAGPERQPSLSRDGTRLVYSTFLTNNNLVVLSLLTGAEFGEVGGERMEVSPAFAPDGSAVAFSSNQLGGRFDLWIQPLTVEGRPTGASRRVTDHPGSVTHPSFSPDGGWIAYQRTVDGQRDIWITPVSGGTPTRFTDDPAPDFLPEWSPDGRQIAFVSERDGTQHVWLAPVADGRPAGAARRLTSCEPSQGAPVWAPDSGSIAFIGGDGHDSREVWVVKTTGTASARQVSRGAGAVRAVWSNGTCLLVSGHWGNGRLQLMRVDVVTGKATAEGSPGLFGYQGRRGEFAVTRDGRLLAAVREVTRGDVWIVEAVRGTY
jgi:Tol biopolymer transport system component